MRADIYDDTTPPTVTAQILPTLDGIRAALPTGYLLETGGTVEDSDRGSKSVAAGMPLFLLVVMTLLMLQLKQLPRVRIMVLLTAPLGLIGVTAFLLIFRVPFGFVAMLGTIALSGMIMRNSVILVDQIEQDIAHGSTPVRRHHRCHRAPLPADRADRAGRRAGDDPAVAQRVLRADGDGHHGRPDRGHRC